MLSVYQKVERKNSYFQQNDPSEMFEYGIGKNYREIALLNYSDSQLDETSQQTPAKSHVSNKEKQNVK